MNKRTKIFALSTLVCSAFITQSFAQGTPVELELSLVIDVSGSVDATEYAQQIGGYAAAFSNPQVITAIDKLGALAVNAIFFDSSAAEGIPFTFISNSAESNAFAAIIGNFVRPSSGGTNPAAGINLATTLLASNAYTGARVVIDVSGDGEGSATTDAAARDNALANGVNTINGLPITAPGSFLEQYFIDNIAGGQGAFVETSDGFDDFERAILQKLLVEITGGPIGVTPILPALRNVEILATTAAYGDFNSRLYRLRSGLRSQPVEIPGTPGTSAKGGMEKGGMEATPSTFWTSRWEVFGSIGYTNADFDRQTISGNLSLPGYEADLVNGTVGAELDVNENFSVGFGLVGTTGDIELDEGSDIDIDRLGAALYGSYYRPLAAGAFHADLLYGYSEGNYDSSRVTTRGTARGDADSYSHLIQGNTGFTMSRGALRHGPIAGLIYQNGAIESFSETGPGALSYAEVDVESFRSSLGYQVSYHMQSNAGLIVPQLRASWEHEFEDDEVVISGISLGNPDSDIAVLGAGVLWQFNPRAYSVLDYEARLGDNSDTHSVNLRVGVSF